MSSNTGVDINCASGVFYRVAVSGTVYVWGSTGITANLAFDKPPMLHLRNDLYGTVVTLMLSAAGTPTTIGTLNPGEAVSLQLQNISGVAASCAAGTDTTLGCVITC